MMLFVAEGAVGAVGSVAAGLCKLWILLLPLAWHIWVDKQPVVVSRPTGAGMVPAVLLGAVILAVMLAVFYGYAWQRIPLDKVSAKAARMHIDTPLGFAVLFSFLVLLNSLLEEYVWRWFVFRQCERMMPAHAAIAASALMFTLHHVIAIAAWAQFQNWIEKSGSLI